MKLRLSLVSLALVAVAHGQAIRDVERLESYGDPPAAFRLHRTSPALIISQGIYTSFQVNVNAQGNNIVADAANEPSLSVSPFDPNRMAIGWRQFNDVASNFRQAGWGYTTNGGANWTFPGVLENNVFRSDPVLDVDADGKFYYLSLLNTFFDDIWGSLNQGATYSRIAAATGGDKEWLIVDRTASIGRGNIYQIWSTAGNNYGGRQFSRSTNGGTTWMNPINIPLQPVWGVMDITPTGDLYIGGSDGGSNFYFVRSTNAKNSAATPTFDLSRTISLGGSVGFSQPINPAGLSGQTSLVTDKTNAPYGGYIYLMSSANVNTNNPLDIRFTRSTDGGNTWAAAKRLNDDPLNGGKYHWMATMAIAPNGRIDLTWNDTRASANNSLSALYYTCSFDGGDTWLPNTQVSPQFNQSLGYPNQNKMGDYMGLVSDDGGARVAYCATFNGEEDIYYLRIPSPESVMPFSISAVAGSLVSGGVAPLKYTDNVYTTLQLGPLSGRSQTAQAIVKGTTTILQPSRLTFKLESNGAAGCSQLMEMFNYQTQGYELVNTRTMATADASVLIDATGNLGRFVNQSTGEVRARISYRRGTLGRSAPLGHLDHCTWTVLQ